MQQAEQRELNTWPHLDILKGLIEDHVIFERSSSTYAWFQ
jgi:hypothetical protein